MNPQGIQTGPEINSEAVIPDPIRAETLADVQAAQETIATTGCGPEEYDACTERFESERQECRDQCISDLGDLRTEVGQTPDIDEALNMFGDSMIGYIENTNEKILLGGESELNAQIDWYRKALGGGSAMELAQNPDALLALGGAKLVLKEHEMQDAVTQLESIQSSSESIEVKLFRLSQLLYEVGDSAGAPAELERAHNTAMGTILSRVIESGNGAVALEFINAQSSDSNELSEMYTDEVIEQLALMTLEQDISIIENNELKELILHERRLIAAEKAIESLSTIYSSDENVMKTLSEVIDEAAEGVTVEFDWQEVNEKISNYNEGPGKNSNNPLPLIQGDILSSIEKSLTSLYNAQSAAADYSAHLLKLEDIQAQGEKTQDQIKSLQYELFAIANADSINQEEVDRIKGKLNDLISENQQQSDNQTDIQNAIKAAERNAEKSIEESEESIYSLEKVINIVQGENFLESYEDKLNSIKENPSHIGAIIDKNELLDIFTSGEIDISTLSYQDISYKLKTDRDIISRFPGHFTVNDLSYIPPSLLVENDFNLVSKILKNAIKEGSSEQIYTLLLISMRGLAESGGVYKSLISMLSGEMEHISEGEKELLQESIPPNLVKSDTENALEITENTTIELKDFNYYQNILTNLKNASEILSEKEENAALRTITEIDTFLETAGLTTQNRELLKGIIKKGYLVQTLYAKHSIDRDPAVWQLIVDNIEHNSFGGLQYIPQGTRTSSDFYDYLLEKSTPSQWHFIQHYIDFNDIPSLYNIYSKIQNGNDDQSDILGFLGIDAKFRLIAKNAIDSGDISGYTLEEQDFVSKILSSSEVFDRDFHTARDKVQQISENNIDHVKNFIESLSTSERLAKKLSPNDIQKLTDIVSQHDPEIHAATRELREIFNGNISEMNIFIFEVNNFKISQSTVTIQKGISDILHEESSEATKEVLGEDEESINNNIDALIKVFMEKTHNKEEFKQEIQKHLKKEGLTDEEIQNIYTNIIQEKYANLVRRSVNKHIKENPNIDPSTIPRGEDLHSYIRDNYDDIYSPEIKDSQSPEIIPSSNSSESSESINYSAYKLSGSTEAPTLSNGETTISITPEEAKLIAADPKNLENIINMYEFFKELNLLGVWNYREELVTAVGEISINLEDDSLREDELLRFGEKILILVRNIEQEQAQIEGREVNIINTEVSSLDSLNLQLANFSGSRELWGDDRSFNTYGEDRFESWMRNYGIIGGITFHTSRVREMIK